MITSCSDTKNHASEILMSIPHTEQSSCPTCATHDRSPFTQLLKWKELPARRKGPFRMDFNWLLVRLPGSGNRLAFSSRPCWAPTTGINSSLTCTLSLLYFLINIACLGVGEQTIKLFYLLLQQWGRKKIVLAPHPCHIHDWTRKSEKSAWVLFS